jgi:hypothetical protein
MALGKNPGRIVEADLVRIESDVDDLIGPFWERFGKI